MSFFGKTFIYNNISCQAYDLMLYDIGGGSEEQQDFASTVSIEEETVGSHWKPYFYGVKYEDRLSFELTFGVVPRRLEKQKFLDRYELNAVSKWLTGHKQYLYLDIEQTDMCYVRYRAIITKLSVVSYSQIPWALRATVECDSPYAYTTPMVTTQAINGSATINLFNQSALNDYFWPEMTIAQSGGTFSIINTSDNNRATTFTDLPGGTGLITVSNDHCIISCENGLNLYPYFNQNFLRLVSGNNILNVTGTGTLTITCEFPINVGG